MRAGMALVGCMLLSACGSVVVSNGVGSSPTTVVPSATVVSTPASTAPAGAPVAVRGLDRGDLRAMLAGLDGVVVDANRQAVADLGPWITVRGGTAGYADVAGALWADLSGDGVAEVVVSLRPGAGRPASGVVVLAATAGPPVVLGDDAFYRAAGSDVRAAVEFDELVLRFRVGGGWEPACCLSGEVTRRFRVVVGRLMETGGPLETGNPAARGPTVERFYRLAGARDLDGAYRLLTTLERQRTAAGQWPALLGGADEVTVSILPTPRPDGLLPFRLVTRSGTRLQAWLGGAALVYDPPTHGWLIDLLTLQPEPA